MLFINLTEDLDAEYMKYSLQYSFKKTKNGIKKCVKKIFKWPKST